MTLTHFADETYGAGLRLDVYRPAGDETRPAVLYVHGGGWGRGDRTTDVDERVRPLAEEGFVVAALDYRLLPEHHFPTPVDDVVAAAAHLRAGARRFGLDPDALGVWGSSAGASLGTLAALRSPGLFQALVHYCGPVDFVASASRSPMESMLLGGPIESAYLGGDGEDYLDRARAASPLTYAGAPAPPSLIVHGDRDRITSVGEARALHDRLSRAGNESTLMTVAGAGHDDPRFNGPLVRAATTGFFRAALS
ncbi:lipase [Actinoplanes cyaneus]|uniref:Lipase n=1 Tax=Actinoplanes cyaneus TaxID=52696 RepID=A0A919ILJ7_9ACTN|nr:alpha/beta hydrolase [Actinoplanes cyaneus]MCW2141222.1 Acetyl esterase/lipase [Actinoplanes cyaneus]GID67291.1 lipase [Actinoplanes cyaneus]